MSRITILGAGGWGIGLALAATRMDTFRNGKTELKNHNNLVFHRVPGVDGLKTGYTEASGFCVTFTCVRAGRRLIGCVTGFKSAKDRDAFCRALLSAGSSIPARMAIMAMTTNSSIRVKFFVFIFNSPYVVEKRCSGLYKVECSTLL